MSWPDSSAASRSGPDDHSDATIPATGRSAAGKPAASRAAAAPASGEPASGRGEQAASKVAAIRAKPKCIGHLLTRNPGEIPALAIRMSMKRNGNVI